MLYELAGDSQVLKEFFVSERVGKYHRLSPDHSDKEAKLAALISASSMFGGDAVLLEGFSSWKKDEKKATVELLSNLPSSVDVFVDGELGSKHSGERVVFSLPKPWEEEKWIDHGLKIAGAMKLKASRGSLRTLLHRIGQNEFRLLRELEKLCNLTDSVTEDLVKKYVSQDLEVEVEALAFEFLENGRSFLQGLDSSRMAFPFFSTVLARISIEIGVVKEHRKSPLPLNWKEIKELSELTGISSSRVSRIVGFTFSGSKEKRSDLSEHLSFERLFVLLSKLQKLDEDIKGGKIDQSIAFFLLNDPSYK